MTDQQITDKIRSLITKSMRMNPKDLNLTSQQADDTLQLTLRLTSLPERVSILPLISAFQQIDDISYSNQSGEGTWNISGQYKGRKVSLSFQMESGQE